VSLYHGEVIPHEHLRDRRFKQQHEGDSIMNKKVNYIVFIGRFQPAHKAHIDTIKMGLEQAEKVIVLIGSANQPRTPENPWTWKERAEMIRSCFHIDDMDRLRFRPSPDIVGNTEWAGNVQKVVRGVVDDDIRKENQNCGAFNADGFLDIEFDPTIKLIGHKKDHTSFYLDMFPQWKGIKTDNIDDLHATDIREMMFEDEKIPTVGIPSKIVDYLNAFMNSEIFENLKDEYDHIQKYKKAWNWKQTINDFIVNDLPKLGDCDPLTILSLLRDNNIVAPHAPTFNTVDAVVVQSGHILLIRRRSAPGKGLWALPGGFINEYEEIEDAVVRELREETKIKVPEIVIRSKVENSQNMKMFSAPQRSLRGRTITYAYYVELPPGALPRVRGSDDAEKAKWVPLSTFDKMEDQLFEDHFRIANHFIHSAED